jgi:hypothetical protein
MGYSSGPRPMVKRIRAFDRNYAACKFRRCRKCEYGLWFDLWAALETEIECPHCEHVQTVREFGL